MSEEEIINQFYKYNIGILNYRNYVKGIYENYYYYSNIIHKGYLIDLKYFKKWKETISYKKLKSCLNCPYDFIKNEIKKYCDFNLINEITKEDQIKYQNARYLISMILNNNEFIIINENLYNLICITTNQNNSEDKKEIPYIKYAIKQLFIYVYLTTNETLIFCHNKNILNNESLISNEYFQINQNYYVNILTLSKSLLEYYKFSEAISYYLNEYYYSLLKLKSNRSNDLSSLSYDKKYFFEGYFIENKWLDEWRNNSNYDIIKNELNSINDTAIQNICNKLLYNNEEHKINFNIFDYIRILDIHSDIEIKGFLENDSIVIVNRNFLELFLDKKVINMHLPIRFYAYNKNIVFYLNNEKIIFNTDDNIISKDEYQNKNIKNLLKIMLFQEEIKQKINMKSQNINKNNSYKINLINKNLLQKYKEYYCYDQLYEFFMNNNDLIKEIKDENNLINNDLLNDDIILDFMRNLPVEYVNLIQEKEILKKYMKNNSSNNFGIKNNSSKYLSNFEIISYNSISSLQMKDFIGESKYYTGECYVCEGKIAIISEDNNKFYYQMGFVDNKGDIITEYFIDSEYIFNSFLIKNIFISKSINVFLKDVYKDKNNNSFTLQDNEKKIICHCRKISDEKEIKDKDNYILKENINKVASILLTLYEFNDNLKKDIKNSKDSNTNILKDCYLIKKEYINDYRRLLMYDKICKCVNEKNMSNNENNLEILSKYIFDNFKNYFKNLFVDKNKKLEAFFNNQNLYLLDLYEIQKYNNRIVCPENFELINSNIYKTNFTSNNINYNGKNINKISYAINEGKIIIKLQNNSLLIGELSSRDNNYYNLFKSELLLNFINKDETLSHFIKFIKNNYTKVTSSLSNNESPNNDILNNVGLNIGQYFHINRENESILFGKDISKNKNLKNYISLIIKLIIEYEKIKNIINKNITEVENNNIEDYYYVVNKKYIEEFNAIFKVNDFYDIINANKHFFINYYYKFEESMIDKMISFLPEQILSYFYDFNIYKIKNLNNNSIYKLSYSEYSINDQQNLKFLNNCNILSKNMILILNEIDKDFFRLEKYNEIKCLIGDKKIFMRLNIEKNFVINIGHLNEDKIFFSDYLIHSVLFRNISFIFENIKKWGFRYISNYLTDNPINNIYDKNLLIGTIYKINNNIELNLPEINGKLLTLIMITIYQFTLLKKLNALKQSNSEDNLEEVFLINKDFLNQYNYENIFNYLSINRKISQIIFNNTISITNTNIINNIINNIELNKLIEIGKNLDKITNDKSIPLKAKPEDIKISKVRYIKIYKEFILVDQFLLNIIENNFNIKYQSPFTFKSKITKKSILAIFNENQNISLLGTFNNTLTLFNINYILDYKNYLTLIKEANDIIREEPDNYIKNHLIFNQNFEKDVFSPIFDANDALVGFGYKYNTHNDYSMYYFSNELINTIRLNIFYKEINNINKNNNKIIKDKFYLINKDWMKRYKENYKYDIINDELKTNNNIKYIFNSINLNEFNAFNMKVILSLIKNMKYDINIYNQSMEYIKKQYNSYLSFEPDRISNNYFDKENKLQYLNTYINFEIVNFRFGKLFNEPNKELHDVIINNGVIIINLPFNLNNKEIWMMGCLNAQNIFVAEYYFIYEQKIFAHNHINYICKMVDLKNYLKKLNFINNSTVIINESKIIGTVIREDSNIYIHYKN